MIAFDPSYVRKAGKHTPGFGYYWWGVAGAAKWGLEIAGIAAVDLNTRTAYHLEAVQSPAHTPAGDTRVTHYAHLLVAASFDFKRYGGRRIFFKTWLRI